MKKKKKYCIAAGILLLAGIACLITWHLVHNSQRADTTLSEGLPVTEEPVSFTFLASLGSDLLQVCDGDLNNSCFYQELERRTNIHINWVNSRDELEIQYHLGQSGTQVPDIMDVPYLNTSLDDMVDNGSILDLTDLIPVYAPNYYRIIQDPELHDMAYTNTGRIAVIYSIKQKKQKPWAGLQIRKDWLDDLGLEVPTTYRELEQVLIAFKEEKGATIPLLLPPSGYTIGNDLNAGFNVSTDFYHIGDQVCYGPAMEGWKEYLTLMHRWYENGLIGPGFSTGMNTYADAQLVSSGASGVWFGLYTFPADCNFEDSDAEIIALQLPTQKEGDQVHIRMADSYSDNSLAISADCRYPELVLKWIDYLFSPEGSLLANYGIEGTTFEYQKDGSPSFTSLITDNPHGLSFTQALKKYTFPPGVASAYVDWERESKLFPAEDVAMCDVWAQAGTDYMLPSNMDFTLEENSRLFKLLPSITSCMRKYTQQFIMGITPLSEYDAYVQELNSYGLEDALEIYQEAYMRIAR